MESTKVLTARFDLHQTTKVACTLSLKCFILLLFLPRKTVQNPRPPTTFYPQIMFAHKVASPCKPPFLSQNNILHNMCSHPNRFLLWYPSGWYWSIIYVYMYVYIYIYIFVYMYVCIYIYIILCFICSAHGTLHLKTQIGLLTTLSLQKISPRTSASLGSCTLS